MQVLLCVVCPANKAVWLGCSTNANKIKNDFRKNSLNPFKLYKIVRFSIHAFEEVIKFPMRSSLELFKTKL